MDQVEPGDRLRRRPCQQFGGVAGVEADIADIVGLDLRQDLCHAVDIGLAADEAGFGKRPRFRDQVFAAAKADLEPDIGRAVLEQSARSPVRCPDVERQMRQQIVRSDRPDGCGACGPCGGRRTSRAQGVSAVVRLIAIAGIARGTIIAASGTADRAAAPAARSTKYTSARNGYARPCRRRRGRPALRYAAP